MKFLFIRRDIGYRLTYILLGTLLMIGCGGGGSTGGTNDSESYAISGTVTGAKVSSVTILVSGTKSARTTTNSSGSYTVEVPAGAYTVTPELLNYTFTPESNSSVTVSNASVSGIDFVSAAATTIYTISGTITGDVTNGVTVNLYYGTGSASTSTGSGGTYSFTVTDGTYALVPSIDGYSFTSASEIVTVSGADISANFTSVEIGDTTTGTSFTSGGSYSSGTSGVSRSYYSFSSSASDTPAVKVSPNGSLELTNCKVTKSGDTVLGTEGSGFYEYNSGVLASSSSSVSGYSGSSAASVTMTNCTVTTNASGANGIFAFGENASAILNYLTITTTGSSNSGGVDATYGGTVTISNSIISTTGGSSAALRTDRYESYDQPSVTATNVTGTTSGTGSPGIYCTGIYNVTDSLLNATGSEAVCIEGKNSVTLTDSIISGVKKWGVIIYQSMSGDSSTGTGDFNMTGGVLRNNFENGPAFFVCDTAAEISLEGAVINNASNMLLVAGTADAAGDYIDNVNSDWGTLGGTVEFTATDQILEGEIIICDSSSSIYLTLTNSIFKGSINNDGIDCTAELAINAGSTWTVTGDSYLSSLTNNGTINGSGKVYVNNVQVY